VLKLAPGDEDALASTLDLPAFEASQRVRRGGYQLHRIGAPAVIAEEAARLRATGLDVITLPEGEARTRPRLVAGGEFEGGALALRTDRGGERVAAADLLIVVRGPIAREYQTPPKRRKIATASLDSSYRFHLHLRHDPRPLELDPGAFEFDAPPFLGSSLLELGAWVEALGPGVPCDDGFRQVPPALGVASEDGGELGAVRSRARGRRRRKDEPPMILDNLQQFRFYSAWRAAVERRRA
jgi:hypothetical protein